MRWSCRCHRCRRGPGSTPDAVTLSGQWNDATLLADFTWGPSTNPNLHSVRMTPGPTYDAGGASEIATVQPPDSNLSTDVGLQIAGDTSSFKVYVVPTTGNEAGSNTVTITRPP